MKKFIFPSFLIVLLLGFSNCSKDESTDTSSMNARLSGSSWAAESVTAAIVNGILTIRATATDKSVLSIEIPDVKQGNTYTLNATGGNLAVYSVINQGNVSAIYSSNNGSGAGGEVVITEVNKFSLTVTGTFSFYLTETDGTGRNFTEGVFNNLKYVTIN